MLKSFSSYDSVFGLSEQGHHLPYLTPDYRFDFIIFNPKVSKVFRLPQIKPEFQTAFFTCQVRNEFFDIDKSVWWNNVDLDDEINLNEWNSFCLTIDLEIRNLTIFQNGEMIVRKHFEVTHDDPESLNDLLPYAYVAGHSGSMADIQIFSRPLAPEEMKMWTLCERDREVAKHCQKVINSSVFILDCW